MDEARLAVSCRADALGFLIGLDYSTDDEIAPDAAKDIIASLPPFVSSVLVTHRTDFKWVADTGKRIGCNTLQLHGDFPLEDIPALRAALPHARVIKAVHVVDPSSISTAARWAPYCDGVLLDTKTNARIGGTGITHDWSISAKIVKRIEKPVVLAGGLNPDNLATAIAAVSPYAVDVNSGVENFDGSKSAEKVEAFIRLAKRAGQESPLDTQLFTRRAWMTD